MAREKRGGIPGKRAGRGKGTGKSAVGRRSPYAQDKTGEDTPCPARGKHEADCICGGTGRIKTRK